MYLKEIDQGRDDPKDYQLIEDYTGEARDLFIEYMVDMQEYQDELEVEDKWTGRTIYLKAIDYFDCTSAEALPWGEVTAEMLREL